MFQPLVNQVSELKTTITKLEQLTEIVLEASFTEQEDIQALQHHESWLKVKILAFKNALYQCQLKFWGISEEEEGMRELSIFMVKWLALVLNLEGNASPTLIKAFQMGRKNHPLLEFLDDRTKNKICSRPETRVFFPTNILKFKYTLAFQQNV